MLASAVTFASGLGCQMWLKILDYVALQPCARSWYCHIGAVMPKLSFHTQDDQRIEFSHWCRCLANLTLGGVLDTIAAMARLGLIKVFKAPPVMAMGYGRISDVLACEVTVGIWMHVRDAASLFTRKAVAVEGAVQIPVGALDREGFRAREL